MSSLPDIGGITAGAVVGFASKILYDQLKEPNLQIEPDTTDTLNPNVTIEGRFVDNALVATSPASLRAYRAKVRNKQKPLFNTAAQNAIAWLQVDGETESFQLCSGWWKGVSHIECW